MGSVLCLLTYYMYDKQYSVELSRSEYDSVWNGDAEGDIRVFTYNDLDKVVLMSHDVNNLLQSVSKRKIK
jgi:hypothetical protein